MSYKSAIEAAGAKVLEFKDFGSWQGEWVALVEYKGEVGWVQGSFGSCSHCDAFESEFGLGLDEESETEVQYQARLASFGESYLGGLMTTELAAKYFDGAAEWDTDSAGAAEWIRETGASFQVQ